MEPQNNIQEVTQSNRPQPLSNQPQPPSTQTQPLSTQSDLPPTQSPQLQQIQPQTTPQLTSVQLESAQPVENNPIQPAQLTNDNVNYSQVEDKKMSKGLKIALWIIIPIVVILAAVGIALAINYYYGDKLFGGIITNNSTVADKSDVYYGDGFSLEYGDDWVVTTMSNGKDALKYKNRNAFLAPVGVSTLSDTSSNFQTISGQRGLYQQFYDYWNNGTSGIKIYSGSDGFSKLTDEIYYATYDYGGASTNKVMGKYILLVSPDDDVILSFMTNANEGLDDLNNSALNILKEIKIDKQVSETEELEPSLYDNMESMRNWNMYSGLRNGVLGKVNSIYGGWRVLSDSEMYWKFEPGYFWWYKSVDDLNDNYWYGTTQIMAGEAGIAMAGLDKSMINEIISASDGKVNEKDIYAIICTPTKIVSDGADRSDTNIPKEGMTWIYVWILVDHGTEGIEAQVLNMDTYESNYYVKIAD